METANDRTGLSWMTSDQLIIHWRELLTVPQDDDSVTRRWSIVFAGSVLTSIAPLAEKYGAPRLTIAQQEARATAERELARTQLELAAFEAKGIIAEPMPDSPELQAAERKRADLEERVRKGELVDRATVIANYDRSLTDALQHVRSEVRKVRDHLSGDWSDEQIEAWWEGVVDGAMRHLTLKLGAPSNS